MHRKHSEKKYIQILIVAGLWYPRNFYFLITFLYAFQISRVLIILQSGSKYFYYTHFYVSFSVFTL